MSCRTERATSDLPPGPAATPRRNGAQSVKRGIQAEIGSVDRPLTPPNFAGRVFLALLCAEDFPEQEPEYQVARWFDLLWLLFPVIGILFFLRAITWRWERQS